MDAIHGWVVVEGRGLQPGEGRFFVVGVLIGLIHRVRARRMR